MKLLHVLAENDAEHQLALDQTGFWGKAGTGCIAFSVESGRFLVAHRSMNVEQPGTWGTWGGAIDDGEDPRAACGREFAEETGFSGQVVGTKDLYVFRSGSFRYYNFLIIIQNEFDPILNWENQGYKWCEFGEWPSPLHFGVQALLNDQDSVHTMRSLTKH